MRELLEAVVEELRSLKTEGVEGVYLEESTLEKLRKLSTDLPVAEPSRRVASPSVEHARDREKARGGKSLVDIWNETQQAVDTVKKEEPKQKTLPDPEPFVLPEGSKQARWEWLRERVLNDPVCQEHVDREGGKKVVFGVGSLDARLFFCGEAPGAEEETKGEPFVGPAGQLLTKIIVAMGLSREGVYIGNIMNWRPEHDKPFGNRPPTDEEMAYCLPYLRAQVEIVKPEVIVALGSTAANGLLGPDPKRTVGRTRGRWLEYDGVPLMVTYHPSYLLHNDTMKSKRHVWEDMLMVMERLGLSISEKQRGYFKSA